MKKVLIAAMLTCFSVNPLIADDHAKVDEKKAIMKVIVGLFDAMRAADGPAHGALIAPNSPMDRVKGDGTVSRGVSTDWTNGIATMEAGAVDEQLHDVKILIEGPLATVWAPFTLNVNGELRSCGVNQFTLAKGESGWQVVYGIDTHTPQKCKK